MEGFKQVVMKHFEEIVVGIIFITAFIGTYLIAKGGVNARQVAEENCNAWVIGI